MHPPASPPPAAGRNVYVDVLRGWSIFGVVCVHFAGSFVTADEFAWSPSFHLGLALNQGFSFAVPLFVFLSGYLAGLSRKSPSLLEYYRGRAWRVGFPYLAASVASFFLLNHYAEWQALADYRARGVWLLQRFCFFGVEPTLYFIPLILQLYLLQPLLRALPGSLHRTVPAVAPGAWVLALGAAFLALHVWLGLQCNRGALNYYVWGRPNVFFWLWYFFAGLHFPALAGRLGRRGWQVAGLCALLVAAGAMAWNYRQLLDPAVVGEQFERNRLDFAYARPEMLVYDLAVVLALAAGITLAWNPRDGVAAFLGRHSLEIYLWHILVLYYGAWRYADTLAWCRRLPDLIVIICAAAALAIALAVWAWRRARAYAAGHRLLIVPADRAP